VMDHSSPHESAEPAPSGAMERAAWLPQSVAGGEKAEGGSAGMTVYLSLFMLLLAFFILLTSQSNFEKTKVEAIRSSLDRAFSLSFLASPADEDEAERVHRQRLSELSDLLRALRKAVGGGDIAVTPNHEEMSLVAPVAGFLSGAGIDLELGRRDLLDRLALLLHAAKTDGRPIRLDIVLWRPSSGQAGLNAPDLQMAQAGALTRAMIEAGAPADALAAGLDPSLPMQHLALVLRASPAPSASGSTP
jgi:Membrane MotB of proton-channel complex MotA/MotB